MVAYEFYVKRGSNEPYLIGRPDEPDLIGILPERRKNRRRITKKSIMKWGTLVAGSYVDPDSVYFTRIEL